MKRRQKLAKAEMQKAEKRNIEAAVVLAQGSRSTR